MAVQVVAGSDDGAGREEVLSVEVVVADELEAAAVEGVCSGAGDDVDEAAGVHAAAGAERGGFDAELADGVGEGERKVAVGHVVVVVATIEAPLGGVATAAGDGDGDGLIGVLAAGEVSAGAQARHRRRR